MRNRILGREAIQQLAAGLGLNTDRVFKITVVLTPREAATIKVEYFATTEDMLVIENTLLDLKQDE